MRQDLYFSAFVFGLFVAIAVIFAAGINGKSKYRIACVQAGASLIKDDCIFPEARQ
jgi:hypothetical protein